MAYLTALIFSSILSWISFFAIIFFTNPQNAGALGAVILYASAAAGLVGFSAVLWRIIKLKKK